MRVLLDTNIVIHRENSKNINISIGDLFYWLDKLKYKKIIHQYSVDEINKYKDKDIKEMYDIKLKAYHILKNVEQLEYSFSNKVEKFIYDDNDRIDIYLLYLLYKERVDILITEDKKCLK
ncbi:hypothetical protein [Malacoplasma iowae]|uniref:hypothetical protein n=1 Tax=Malacoplasma iowae TaxID=2116 RepID=UPI003872BE2C|nr:hypothetical protein QX181_04985 [Malacoplasma iowae]